jgi:hypothetical protein
MSDIVELARHHRHIAATHYEGCEADHIGCLVEKLADEVERLRAALRWYADKRNHFPVERRRRGDPDPAVVIVDEPAIMTDCGRRAREALEAKP